MTEPMTHVWRLRVRLGERHGEPCRFWAKGTMNSIGVEFGDGYRTVCSRWAVRRMIRVERGELEGAA